jgi:uncharacterized metal-binding protein YceD (DUF177 family)
MRAVWRREIACGPGPPAGRLPGDWRWQVAPSSELEREVLIEPWPEGGLGIELEATAQERSSLARRFDLVELRSLSASGRLEREGCELRFRGRLQAEVVQSCVVSLDPVASRIEAPIERRYRRLAPGEASQELELLVDPEAAEVEPLRGTSIDFGEAVAEELGLALELYPRADDAYERLPALGPDVSLGDALPPASPFAVLEDLYDNADGAR